MKNFLLQMSGSSSLIELLFATVVMPLVKAVRTVFFLTTTKPTGPGNYEVSVVIFRARLRPW